MSRVHRLDIPDARRPRSLRRLWLMVAVLMTVFVAYGINGQVERGHRTARAPAIIESIIRQPPATFVSAAYVLIYSFEVGGTVVRRSTMRKASQWSSEDRFGIVCYDPDDLANQILLSVDDSCPG